MGERLDIILFGASGFTGRYCIDYVYELINESGKNLTWGIAGRSEEKLKQSLADCRNIIDTNFFEDEDYRPIPIIIADINDYESLIQMTARAKVIINCCGPYRFFGEPVVKACIETGTHQVDVCGEPQYMEYIQLHYNEAAREEGVYIISACGFDSIPCDLGMLFLQKNFEGTLNSAEIYLHSQPSSSHQGAFGNYGTWESLIHSVSHASELRNLRRELFQKPLPEFLPKLRAKPSLHKSDLINTWNIPFMGADRSVVVRTQRYLFEHENIRPTQVQIYLALQSIVTVILMMIFGWIFSFLVKYDFGRNLLLKHPKLFSYGMFSHEGPTRESAQNTKFAMMFFGKGWTEKLSRPQDAYTTPPSSSIVVRVSAFDPAYGITCIAVTLAAIVVLEETNKLPKRGGVFTPGAAFFNTSLIERLQNNSLNFEVVSKL